MNVPDVIVQMLKTLDTRSAHVNAVEKIHKHTGAASIDLELRSRLNSSPWVLEFANPPVALS